LIIACSATCVDRIARINKTRWLLRPWSKRAERAGGSNVIDKRVIERQIRKGKLDAAAYRRTLEGLPDVSDRVARDIDPEPVRSVASAVSSVQERAPAPESASHDDTDDVDDDDDEGEGEGEGEGEDASPETSTSV
jgi:hypothetical protein